MKHIIILIFVCLSQVSFSGTYNLSITIHDIFEKPGSGIYIELLVGQLKIDSGTTDATGLVSIKNLKQKSFEIAIYQNDTVTNQYYFYTDKRRDQSAHYIYYKDYSSIITGLVEEQISLEMKRNGYNSFNDLPDTVPCEKENDAMHIPPSFYKGTEVLEKYLTQSIQYPKKSIEQGDQGKIYVAFTVNKNGSLTDVQIVRGLSKELDKETIRLIHTMPKWLPATCNGVPYSTRIRLPLIFSLH